MCGVSKPPTPNRQNRCVELQKAASIATNFSLYLCISDDIRRYHKGMCHLLPYMHYTSVRHYLWKTEFSYISCNLIQYLSHFFIFWPILRRNLTGSDQKRKRHNLQRKTLGQQETQALPTHSRLRWRAMSQPLYEKEKENKEAALLCALHTYDFWYK